MKNSFQELYEITKLDRKKSPWSKKRDFDSRLSELKGEVNEAIEAYESGDMEHFKDELGDVYFNLTFLIALAEEKGIFTGKDVIENMLTKYKRRKPWVFENTEMTEEEEMIRWNEAKAKERQEKEIIKNDQKSFNC